MEKKHKQKWKEVVWILCKSQLQNITIKHYNTIHRLHTHINVYNFSMQGIAKYNTFINMSSTYLPQGEILPVTNGIILISNSTIKITARTDPKGKP